MSNFRASYPIDFELYDQENENVLYIADKADQLLTLQIRNAATEQILLKTAGKLSNTNFNFALRFRPGTLAPASLKGAGQIKLIAETESNWEMLPPEKDKSGMDVIYLRTRVANMALDPNILQTIVFKNMGADGRQGARGTRVELLGRNLSYTDKQSLEITREARLEVINHRGRKNIPMYMGFVGDNAVLNDGKTANELSLRLLNQSIYDATDPHKSELTFRFDATDPANTSKIILSFHTGESSDESALASAELIKAAKVLPPKDWDVTILTQGETPEWILTPKKEQVLPGRNAPASNSNHLDITIQNIITAYPTAHTYLIVRYENIPGYWDGQVALLVEKQPLVYSKNGNVGIGIASPAVRLDVNGDVNISKGLITGSANVGIGTAAPQGNLHVSSGESGNCKLILEADSSNKSGNENSNPYLIFRQDGGVEESAVYQGDNQLILANSVTPGSGIIFKTGNDVKGFSKAKEQMRITGEGNVGIGVNTPSVKLDVGGDVNIGGKLSVGDGKLTGNSSGVYLNSPSAISFKTGFKGNSDTSAKEAMVINEFGNVGIGISKPLNSFEVNGQAAFLKNVSIGGNWVGASDKEDKSCLFVEGNIYMENVTPARGPRRDPLPLYWDGTKISIQNSSKRYKKDIQKLDDDCKKILTVDARQFKMKDSKGDVGACHFGYIAEELEAAGLIHLVIYNAEGLPDGVKYEKVAIYTNEVVKVHEATLAKQAKQLAEQQTLIKKQGQMLADMEKRLQKLEKA